MKINTFLIFGIVCGMMLLAGPMSMQVLAGPVLDGKSEGYSEYSIGYYVDYTVDNDPSFSTTGELWLGEDSANLYLAFVEPLSLVDNSYGVDGGIDNSVDWWKNQKKGKERVHTFKHLKNSDMAGFTFRDEETSETLLNIEVDYISPDGSGGFASKGVETGQQADGGVIYSKSGYEQGDITAITSLQYNYNQFGEDYSQHFGEGSYSPETVWNRNKEEWDSIDYNGTDDDPDNDAEDAYAVMTDTQDSVLSGWIFEVVYEIKVDKALLDGNGIDGLELTDLVAHVSPYKEEYIAVGVGGVIPGGGGPGDPVPEPTTILLLGSGLIGLAGLKRKHRKL